MFCVLPVAYNFAVFWSILKDIIDILRCESSICQFERKTEECSNLRDCISNIIAIGVIVVIVIVIDIVAIVIIVGIVIALIAIVIIVGIVIAMIMIFTGKKLCSTNKSCDCTQGFCEKPWWANGERDCRHDQV